MTPLHHRPQPRIYGCLYYALYALTGDEAWLQYADDISDTRWLARLHDEGAMLLTYYADNILHTPPPPGFWEALRGHIAPQGEGGAATTHLPLLVTVEGLSGLGRRHLVALALPVTSRDDVWVSDSAEDAPREFTFADFLASRYAQASEVAQLLPADVDTYPYQSGAEFVSQADPAPYVM